MNELPKAAEELRQPNPAYLFKPQSLFLPRGDEYVGHCLMPVSLAKSSGPLGRSIRTGRKPPLFDRRKWKALIEWFDSILVHG